MTETEQLVEEALASLKLVEENWDKMIDEAVANSGQFQQECKQMFDDPAL